MSIEQESSAEKPLDIAGYKAILTSAYEKSRLGTHVKVTDLIESLKSQYTKEELEQTRLYHLLAGSTPRPEEESEMQLDLPSGELANFINSLQN